MYRIRKIDALQILDSRGIPTVFVEIELKNGIKYKIEVDTDLDDYYACEVKIYANR